MIDDNWDLFYKSNQTKDILIVDSDAVVVEVEGEEPEIIGATIEIHTADIKSDSFTLDESLCAEDNLKFGLCNAAKISFVMQTKNGIPNLKSTEYSKVLDVYLYFNGDSSTLMQIGQYICDKDKHTADRKEREVELYDALYLLYDFDVTEWYNNLWLTNNTITIKNFRDSLFAYLLDEFDYPIVQATATLILDSATIVKSIESDVITFGFLMEGLLEVNGVFGHINRIGEFDYVSLVSYDTESITEITDDFREPPTEYEDFIVWGIGYVIAYDQNNLQIGKAGSSNKKRPSIYTIVDNWVYDSFRKKTTADADMAAAVSSLHEKIVHTKYKPCELKTAGNPCIEVGDKIDVAYKIRSGRTHRFYTYVLERHLTGIGTMRDTFTSRGDKKQPNYQVENDNWHESDSDSASSGYGSGGVSQYYDIDWQKFCEVIRNIGYRLLDEPRNVNVVYNKEDGQVEIKWEDPADIATNYPVPVEWAGTVIVRSEGNPPLHRFDGDYGGTVLVDSTTRDAYKVNAYVDSSIQGNKRYYYGIFPYHVAIDDANLPIKHYRFTKVISVDTHVYLTAPTIGEPVVDGLNVTLPYEVPTLEVGTYTTCKLVIKKGSIPTSISDGTAVDIDPADTSIDLVLLDQESTYYCVIFVEDSNGNTAYSDPADAVTGINEGSTFFEANFLTDGRDKVHYKDINVTETIRDYFYDEITKTMKQGQCISFFNNTVWDISNGSLNVSAVTDEGGALFFWGYDPSQIEQYVFPENCTVVIETEVLFTTALDPENEYDNRMVYFTAYAHQSQQYPYDANDIFGGGFVMYDYQVNTWYNLRLELTIQNGVLVNSKTIGYLNNELMPEGNAWSSFGSAWVSVDITDSDHHDCCGIGIDALDPMKIRKYKISYRT